MNASAEPKYAVLVSELEGGLRQEIDNGRHQLYADEPVDVGGEDSGMNPYELLLAALGACTAMTLRMYARRKNWPLDGVRIRLQHEKIHAQDCQDCETRNGKIDRITRFIEVTGALDAEQRQKLLEIANKCPVHRTLTAEIKIQTQLT